MCHGPHDKTLLLFSRKRKYLGTSRVCVCDLSSDDVRECRRDKVLSSIVKHVLVVLL